jgi:hypothetical protein
MAAFLMEGMIRDLKDRLARHQEQADLVAERIGSEDFDRRDGAIYEAHALEAQKIAAKIAAWERILESYRANRPLWDRIAS